MLPNVVRCDVGGLDHLDEAALDTLARLQLEARRAGRTIELCNARAELVDLLALAGLSDVIVVVADSAVEVNGEPEQRKERGLDEEVDPGDAVA
jgi:anti-anti-sigma regulatory factor